MPSPLDIILGAYSQPSAQPNYQQQPQVVQNLQPTQHQFQGPNLFGPRAPTNPYLGQQSPFSSGRPQSAPAPAPTPPPVNPVISQQAALLQSMLLNPGTFYSNVGNAYGSPMNQYVGGPGNWGGPVQGGGFAPEWLSSLSLPPSLMAIPQIAALFQPGAYSLVPGIHQGSGGPQNEPGWNPMPLQGLVAAALQALLGGGI